MLDTLSDVMKAVNSDIKTIKVTGSDKETLIQGRNEGKTFFLEMRLANPIPELKGEFGISNFSLLNGLLNHPNYKAEASSFSIRRRPWKDSTTVEQFEFRDPNGEGANFRLMSPELVKEQAEIKNIPWDVSIPLNKSKISEFESFVRLYREIDTFFKVKTKDQNLIVVFGDDTTSTHTGTMVFENNIEGTMAKQPNWIQQDFLNALKFAADKPTTLKFSSRGIIGVFIQHPIGNLNYYIRSVER